MMQLKRAESGGNGEVTLHPLQSIVSLDEIWASLDPKPPGVLNQVGYPNYIELYSYSKTFINIFQLEEEPSSPHTTLTATIFLPMQCRLVCGREDGSIIMVPATQTIMLHLLSGRHQKFTNWPQHQVI